MGDHISTQEIKRKLAAFREVSFIKISIAVDEDVDFYDLKDVMWAVVTRTRLEEDLNVIRHVMGFSKDPYHQYQSMQVIDAIYPLTRGNTSEG